MLLPDVAAYYECGFEEGRLTARTGRLEWARTWELLERFLPPAPATVLDVGGGPGAYAIPLARAGHRVHLVDAMPLHVAQARAAAAAAEVTLASTEVGDARELAFPAGAADAVLLLGPLYHLLDVAERARALAAARRVLRPGGVLLAAGISRFATLLESLRHGWGPEHREVAESALLTGTHRNPGGQARFFATAHFTRPDELAAELTATGFTGVEVLAVEGPGTLVPDVDEWMDDPDRRAWLLRQIRRTETEPALLGASPHLLALGRAS